MDDRRARAEAIEGFAATLRELRNAVGNPPYREMSGRSGAISHTTLHEATKGNRLPSWETTVEFVKACDADPAAYRDRWEQANRVVRSASAGEPAARADSLTEQPSAGAARPAAGAARPTAGLAAAAADLGAQRLALASQAPPSLNDAPPLSSGDVAPPSSSGDVAPPSSSGDVAPPSSSGDAAPPPSFTGDTRPPASSGDAPPPPAPPSAGDAPPPPPSPPPGKGRSRSARVAALAAAVLVVAGAVAVVVTVLNSGAATDDPGPAPTGPGSSAAALSPADCPVRSTNPPWAPPLHPGDAAVFIEDVTLPDCARVDAGKTVTKVWRLKNAGTVPWTGYSLRRLDFAQQADQCQTISDVPIKDTLPGATVDVETVVTTPRKPGLCYVRFKMVDASGAILFPGSRPINFQIIVDAR
ncbi:NBR1-Ig-like domain-containing protein [Nonomuraea wenchangensis]|uniref:NBR1-Ig-like domain-containing protein n=1 Tax=Nonomuraea wenchangensis TaxID=568860 RepID=UPI00341281C4